MIKTRGKINSRVKSQPFFFFEHFVSVIYAPTAYWFCVSGLPENLVDSERILTELRTEGYDVVPRYDDAELVIVNTCGFIDSAVQESLEAIGEALNEMAK